jgi:microcystin-dependent protein
MKKLFVGLLCYVLSVAPVFAQATLLPNAKQVFLDSVGNPLVGGTVTSFVPNSTTKKTTWQDAGQTENNTNPVILDAAGRAVIYGQGNYRQLVKDADGNTIWDAPTSAIGSSQPSGATGTDTAPVGSIMVFTGAVVPVNWQIAAGQTLSRTDFSALLTAITISQTGISCTSGNATLTGWSDTSQMRVGAPVEAACIPTGSVIAAIPSNSSITLNNNAVSTLTVSATVFDWGNGDGTTTFNVPDLRGRVPAGADAMGGTAANRLTTQTTITTISGSTTASIPSTANATAGMSIISTNVPAGATISTVNPVTVTTILTTSGSPTATVPTSTGLIAGQTITSPNVTPGTTISSISGTTITMSANANAVATHISTTSGSTTATVTSADGIATGMTVTSTNVPGATTVSAISGKTLTLSAAATLTASGTAASFSGAAASVASTFTAASDIPIILSSAATGAASGTTATLLALAGASAPGAAGGAASHTLTAAESASLSYSSIANDPGHTHDYVGSNFLNAGATGGGTAFAPTTLTTSPEFTGITVATTANAGNQAHSILQPTLTVNYIIKVKSNTSGAGGVVSLGGMVGDIICDATFLCAPNESNVNSIGLATQPDKTILANISGDVAQPTPTTWSDWFDAACGSAQGDIVYRSATAWGCLPAGTNGFVLATQGAGQNPVWIANTNPSANQLANTVSAGPASGAAAPPAFRALVGADLPNPSASSKGGVESAAAVTHQWINSISTLGVPAQSQPAFSDISGQAAAAQIPIAHITTESALVALAPGAFTSLWLDGYYSAGDGGEGLFVWNGSSSATPDNGVVIQPGAGGTGRWIRATYSTKPNIRWWGAHCDFNGSTGTDDSGVFNAAVAWAATQNGAHIELPRNAACAIANQVIIRDNNIFFEGYSFASTRHSVGQAPADCSSSVYWTSAATNQVMFAWTPHTGTGARAVNGGGMKNVCLFGQNVAAFGLEVQTVRNGVFDHLYFDSFSFIALYGTVIEGIDPSEPCDTQWNSFSNIVINNINPTYSGSPTTGRGMVVDGIADSGRGDGGCNFSENTIRNLWVNTWTTTALELDGSDNNLWFNVAAGVFAPGAGVNSVDIGFGQLVAGTNGGSSSESFYRLSYSGAFLARGTTTCSGCVPVRGIMVYALDRGNGTASPTMEPGAQVTWFDSTGQWQAITKLSTAPVLGSGSLPTVSSCGTSPSIQAGGNNVAGVIVTGSGNPSACTVTYQVSAPANVRQPICIVQAIGSPSALGISYTTTSFTVNSATVLPAFVAYHCIGTG